MKILFFEPDLTGHRMEYIHHEVCGAVLHADSSFVFVVPWVFKKSKESFIWPDAQNVSFVFLTDLEYAKCNRTNRPGRIWAVSKTVRKYARLEHADHVFMNTLIDGMPFIPFMMPWYTKISGIIYGCYLWQKDILSRSKYMYYSFLYWLLKRSKRFNKVFLLNDTITVNRLNTECGCNRFGCLPDPVTHIDRDKLKDIRAEYGIESGKTVYLLFPIAKRKHVLDILDAVGMMDDSELQDKAFMFVGKLDKEIEEAFHNKIEVLRDRCQIITVEKVVPYQTLFNFCYSADVLLTIYDNYHMSSGVLGYCAYFNKCVISISKGLLGHLVRTYNMGICIDKTDADSIADALRAKPSKCYSDYVESHTIERFNEVIFSAFNQSNL